MMVALLHSNGQLRTERDGDTEKGGLKPAVQQKTTEGRGKFSGCRLPCVIHGAVVESPCFNYSALLKVCTFLMLLSPEVFYVFRWCGSG